MLFSPTLTPLWCFMFRRIISLYVLNRSEEKCSPVSLSYRSVHTLQSLSILFVASYSQSEFLMTLRSFPSQLCHKIYWMEINWNFIDMLYLLVLILLYCPRGLTFLTFPLSQFTLTWVVQNSRKAVVHLVAILLNPHWHWDRYLFLCCRQKTCVLRHCGQQLVVWCSLTSPRCHKRLSIRIRGRQLHCMAVYIPMFKFLSAVPCIFLSSGRCQYNVIGWNRSHGLRALSRGST